MLSTLSIDQTMSNHERRSEIYEAGLREFVRREPQLVAERYRRSASHRAALNAGISQADLQRSELKALLTEYADARGFESYELLWHWMAKSEDELRELQEDFLATMALDMDLSKPEFLELWGLSLADLGYKFRLRSVSKGRQQKQVAR